jgi:hypothetical protein
MALADFYNIQNIVVPAVTETSVTIPDKAKHVSLSVSALAGGGVAEVRIAAGGSGKDLPFDLNDEPELANAVLYLYSTAGATVQVFTRTRLA